MARFMVCVRVVANVELEVRAESEEKAKQSVQRMTLAQIETRAVSNEFDTEVTSIREV